MPASQQRAARKTLNPAWPHFASATAVAFVVLGSFLRWAMLDWADPYHCGALLNSGQWLDPGVYKNWQPDNCLHIPMRPQNLVSCLASPPNSQRPASPVGPRRQLLFVGDSVVRQTFFATARLLDANLPKAWEQEGEKHSDREAVIRVRGDATPSDSIRATFWWDPYLNSTRTLGHLNSPAQSPAMLVLGSGLWYLRNPSSGGLAAWEAIIDRTFAAISASQPSRKSSSVIGSSKSVPWGSANEKRAVGDVVVFLPIVNPVESLLNQARAKTIIHTDVEAMNADLLARLSQPSPPPVHIPTVFNRILVDSETKDGLHFSDKILNKQAELLLAWRCNDYGQGSGQNESTCCRRSRRLRPLQALTLAFFLAWAPLSRLLVNRISNTSRLRPLLAPQALAVPLTTFGLALIYLFMADRTTVFLKEQKHFDPWVFGSVTLAFLLAGIASCVTGGKDLGFLGRDITDEWKGWMQIAILIYHIYGGSKISGIYNPIRVLVASYLFMTGYGHFFYYYKKKDFGFQRIAMVMVRLNLLSVALPYTMNTNYVFYYFAPLVSWWYLIIYSTMAIGHKHNERSGFLLTKILTSATIHTLIIRNDWILANVFALLKQVFRIEWSAREWTFRVSLDLYIVYGGMLCAYAYVKLKEHRFLEHPRFPVIAGASMAASLGGLVWYFWFELSLPNKFAYNGYHPVVCFVPILSFIVLRNATPLLRSSSSRLFCFIGKCSLETFILQFHGWMASDTKGVLLVVPGTRWRPVSLVISTICFVWMSHKVAGATGEITEWLVGQPKKSALPLPGASSAADNASQAAIPLSGVTSDDKAATSSDDGSARVTVAPRKDQHDVPSETSIPGGSAGRSAGQPDWMAPTVLDQAEPRTAVQGYARIARPWRDETLVGLLRRTADLAGRHATLKLAFCLAGLWIANWIY